jgi:Tryptophan dimethylallyltransferase
MSTLALHIVPPMACTREAARSSYGSFGERKLSLLCDGLGLSRRSRQEGIYVFRLLSQGWSHRQLGSIPAWQSDITDDATPFEFSVAFDGGTPKLRILVESQQPPLTLSSSWAAGLRLNQRLRYLPNVDLAPFERVRDLFAPTEGATGRCALWHAAVLDESSRAMYKVYLNPQVNGAQSAKDVVLSALSRLGLHDAIEFLRARPVPYCSEQFLYFSVDLAAGFGARAKIYFSHPGIRADEIERSLEGTRNYILGDGERWIRRILGSSGPFQQRPILTCLSFTAAGGPPTATLHMPIRDYTCDDEYSVERACEYLSPRDGRALRRGLESFACRPLDIGRSLVTYVSLRRLRQGLNVTAYIAPEAFAMTPAPLIRDCGVSRPCRSGYPR